MGQTQVVAEHLGVLAGFGHEHRALPDAVEEPCDLLGVKIMGNGVLLLGGSEESGDIGGPDAEFAGAVIPQDRMRAGKFLGDHADDTDAGFVSLGERIHDVDHRVNLDQRVGFGAGPGFFIEPRPERAPCRDDGAAECFFVGEVVEKTTLGQAGFRTDLIDGGGVEALAKDELHRSRQQALLGFGGIPGGFN